MLTRNPQADVRSGFAHRLTNSQSTLRVNRSNNSFATATDLGVYRGGAKTFRASGTLSKRNPVDYFKFQIAKGASSLGITETIKVRSGGLRVTSYIDTGSGITKVTATQDSKGTSSSSAAGFSNYPVNATFYVKCDRPKGTTRYQENVLFF